MSATQPEPGPTAPDDAASIDPAAGYLTDLTGIAARALALATHPSVLARHPQRAALASHLRDARRALAAAELLLDTTAAGTRA